MFTAPYELRAYINQPRFVFKGVNTELLYYQNLDDLSTAFQIFQPKLGTHFQHLIPMPEGSVFLKDDELEVITVTNKCTQ